MIRKVSAVGRRRTEIRVYEGKDYETEFETALAHTESDSDTKQVGYVGTNYSMDQFKETFAALKAKRGRRPSNIPSAAPHE